MSALATEQVEQAEPRLGIFEDLDEETYHQDPTSVSASQLKRMLKSPAHFLTTPKVDAKLQEAFDIGTVAHSKVLGVGADTVAYPVEVLTASGAIGPKAREWAEEQRKQHLVPLKAEQIAAADRMADAVLTHPVAGPLLENGAGEVSMFWADPGFSDEKIRLIRRCRWDWIDRDRCVGLDIKTTASAEPEALAKTVANLHYDLSAAYYLDVAAGLEVEIAAYALVWVEKTPPHAVVVTDLDDAFLERGRAFVRMALDRYRACLDSGRWPAYADDTYLTLTPPKWATYPEEASW